MRLGVGDLGAASVTADVCVVGSGPAGMTLALALEAAGLSVLLLEAGDATWSDRSQAVYDGAVVGDPYPPLDVTRLRYWGGTSNHWVGMCRPLDAIDFQAKPGAPQAAWPIARADLDPYLPRAREILKIPPIPDDRPLGDGVARIHFAASPPVRFADAYGPHLAAAPRIACVTGANVTMIATDGTRVTGLEVRDYDGTTTHVRCGRYVLATGGIEVSRMLLWADAAQGGALVPAGAPVGRYWMDHPHFTLGAGVVPVALADPRAAAPIPRTFVALTPARQRALGVMNCGLRMVPTGTGQTDRIIADLARAAPAHARRLSRLAAAGQVTGIGLRAAWEQGPNPDSRITLSKTDRDRFGTPRARLDWQKTDRDIATARATATAVGDHLAATGPGRIRLERWVMEDGPFPTEDEIAGNHHMGGARMADSPAHGVVDADGKVFGQDNLYVAGSAVFPSGGHANPTLTIVQLALRLADHLAGRAIATGPGR